MVKPSYISLNDLLMIYDLQHWTGTFYDDTTLQALGLIVQLGHNGSSCSSPGLVQNFTIVDSSGIHQINLRYCECHQAAGGSRSYVQLLRARLFTSSVVCPRKAFTFDVLDTFHLMTLQGKISAYDFYTTLSHKSDNTGLRNVKVSPRKINDYELTRLFPIRTATPNF